MNDSKMINKIKIQTEKMNINNIKRTNAYLYFFDDYPEIKWSFLASMVSRNAGWNMTDLKTDTYQKLLSIKMVRYLFMTYERANWFIFSDAYPQLLIYHFSIMQKQPLFHLLKYFYVSTFMIDEWMHFWLHKNKNRLLYAQIINEQNLIQKPVIEEPFFKWRVFHNIPYLLQEKIHLNAVLFPTLSGSLYGLSIKKFTDVTERINTGKKLASILFDERLYQEFLAFAKKVYPDGTRREYEQFLKKKYITADHLEEIYPNITHENKYREDWYEPKNFLSVWWKKDMVQPQPIGDRFYKKRRTIEKISGLTGILKNG
ncbi:Protein of unknown function [Salinibacillus kushneri]|uniref:DUF2515 domain-containing protein n=1 Tax=Salinibacillus kushneri TaxID=237682 RepID=A0A1I0DGU9_9BACI|nr:DUF2515 family protein [Salinibacillus kushneri]SET31269.1 Protein of unknown function [Salinibacillus kushneri]